MTTWTGVDPADYGLRRGEARVGDVTLRWAEAGEGPIVLLLHGFPECWVSWRRQIDALTTAGYRVIAPDQRGYPNTSKPQGVASYHIDRLVEDVEGLRQHLGAPHIHLVGHDWGAIVAWFYAMRHDAHLQTLTIMNVPHPAHFLSMALDPEQLRMSWYILFFQLPWLPAYLLRKDGARNLRKTITVDRIPGTYERDDIALTAEAIARNGVETLLHWYRGLLRLGPVGVRRRLQRIETPTLVLWGERDRALHKRYARPPVSWVPDQRLRYFPRASHWVQSDESTAVSEALLEHILAHP